MMMIMMMTHIAHGRRNLELEHTAMRLRMVDIPKERNLTP